MLPHEVIFEDSFPTLKRGTEQEPFFSKSKFKEQVTRFITWTEEMRKNTQKIFTG